MGKPQNSKNHAVEQRWAIGGHKRIFLQPTETIENPHLIEISFQSVIKGSHILKSSAYIFRSENVASEPKQVAHLSTVDGFS
ncbi:hypothetical protein TNCV_2650091 [Trichonephila clavipes]|nr:hypothetical protein TNCV_2650091 [Trichonephila clavipes]